MSSFAAALGLAAAWFALGASRRAVAGTTLAFVWWTAALGLVFWTVGIGFRFSADLDAAPWAGHLFYLTAIATLCPFVAVLGARRPIDKAWPAFVLLPMWLVLALPSISTLWRGGDVPLRLETPTLVGFAFVLTMGVGNYLFTRLSLPALLTGAAIGLLIHPSTESGADSSLHACVGYAGVLLGLAAVGGLLLMRPSRKDLLPHERLWTDFRNRYGVVWARRVMDRVNWTAAEEGWPLRLELTGIVWTDANAPEEARRRAVERLLATFGWLLKRFVDERWIDRRLMEN